MTGFKHNRKRNSALVYELLIRRMASQIIAKDLSGCKKTTAILSRYFSNGSPISSERELSETIKNTRGVPRTVAEKVLHEVYARAAKIDSKELVLKKNGLIKEINHTYGMKFFAEHRIPDYRIFASIQMAIDGSYTNLERLSENVQRIRLEEAIINFMTTTTNESGIEKDPRIDGVVCSMAVKRFQEKYGNNLIPRQKKLLDHYIRSLIQGKDDGLKKFMKEESDKIRQNLHEGKSIDDLKKDAVAMQKYKDVQSIFESLDISSPNAETVKDMLLYQKLCGELES